MASAACTVNATTTQNGVNVAGGTNAHIALVDTAGVEKWVLTCIGTDERFVPATVTLALTINQVTKQADITQAADDGLGAAWIFQSVVNDGKDVNGKVVPAYTTTFAIYLPCANGIRISAVNETVENSAAYGWTKKFNDAVRNALPGLGVSVTPVPNTVLLRNGSGGGELATLEITGSLITFDADVQIVYEGGSRLISADSGQNIIIGDGGDTNSLELATSGSLNFLAFDYLFNDSSGNPILSLAVGGGAPVLAFADGSDYPNPTFTQTQLPGNGATAGQTFTIVGQKGQNQNGVNANNNGGPVVVQGGLAGTGGSGAAGSSGQVTVKSNGANGVVGLEATDAAGIVYAKAPSFVLYDATGVATATWTLASAGATSLAFGALATLTITQTKRTGNGANAGAILSVTAQQGQNVSGGTNNNGGDAQISGGAVGTGGSAGLAGRVKLIARGATYTFGQQSLFGGTSNFIDVGGIGGLVGTSIVSGSTAGDAYYEANGGAVKLLADGAVTAYFGTPSATGGVVVSVFSSQTAVTYKQDDLATTSATGAATLLQAQNATGTSSTGGSATVKSGTGTSQDGFIFLTQGAATPIKIGVQNLVGQGSKTYVDFGASSGGMAASSQLISCSYGVGSDIYFFTNAGTCHFGQGGNLDVLTVTSIVGLNTTAITVNTAAASFTFKQSDNTTNSATAATWTIQAPNATGTTATGGRMIIKSGTGTTSDGELDIFVGAGATTGIALHGSAGANNLNLFANSGTITCVSSGATLLTIGGNAPLLWGTTTIVLTTGTTTLSTTQQATPTIVYSASLTGNVVVDFGNVVGNWEFDIRLVTLNAHTVSVKSGTTTVALPTATTTKNLFNIRTDGSNGISIG